jgi:hypothetical protein
MKAVKVLLDIGQIEVGHCDSESRI